MAIGDADDVRLQESVGKGFGDLCAHERQAPE